MAAARAELGLSQPEFAVLVGLRGGGSSISKIERGETQLTPARARIIADKTRKPISYFLDVTNGTPAVNGDAAALRPLMSQAVALLEEIRRRLPPEPD